MKLLYLAEENAAVARCGNQEVVVRGNFDLCDCQLVHWDLDVLHRFGVEVVERVGVNPDAALARPEKNGVLVEGNAHRREYRRGAIVLHLDVLALLGVHPDPQVGAGPDHQIVVGAISHAIVLVRFLGVLHCPFSLSAVRPDALRHVQVPNVEDAELADGDQLGVLLSIGKK